MRITGAQGLILATRTAAFEQYGKAIPLYQEYVKRFPERSEGYTNLGSVHEALGDMQKAEDYYEQALTKNSDEPTTFLALGYFFNQQKTLRRGTDSMGALP